MAEFDLQAFVIKTLRRALKRTPQFTLARQRACIERGRYKCELCNKALHYHKMEIDHKIPVISIDGKNNDLESIVNRIFCKAEDLQYICKPCHREKTNKENKLRRENKKRGKPSHEDS